MVNQAHISVAAFAPGARPARPSGTKKLDPAFDRWLEAELTRSYGAVLREDVPDSLLELIDRKPEKRPG